MIRAKIRSIFQVLFSGLFKESTQIQDGVPVEQVAVDGVNVPVADGARYAGVLHLHRDQARTSLDQSSCEQRSLSPLMPSFSFNAAIEVPDTKVISTVEAPELVTLGRKPTN